MKCPNCGGIADEISTNQYKCPYCSNKFSSEPVAARSKAPEFDMSQLEKYMDSLSARFNNSDAAPKKNEGVSVFEDNVNGVLEITWSPRTGVLTSGSGLLIDSQGYALTNAHVVSHEDGTPTQTVNVKIAGQTVTASVIRLGDNQCGRGAGVDLALIKLSSLPAKAKALTIADFNNVRIGEQVFVIGNSLGDGTCITSGIVSDKQRKINGHTVLMTDCAINGGNSGGPIFNSDGQVIGVICSSRIKADGSATEGMNYAIPANIAIDFLNGQHTAVKVSAGEGKIRYKTASTKSGPVCPRCKSTNTDVENNIGYCYDCDYEWGVK